MIRRGGIRIGRIFGIPIFLHPSWFIIFVLITLSLTTQFRQQHPAWTTVQHWGIGILTSLLFFGSVLFHELSHSVVALRYKIPVVSITLFVFGGVAHIGREPGNAKQEFNIAIAGPLSSYFLAGTFYVLTLVFPYAEMMGALAAWLAVTNFALATFNLVPGFPLDGGRILRAIIWGVTKDYSRSTRIAARSGQLIAYAMILIGIWQALTGQFTGGLWLAFIGWFLLTAAQESVAQVAVREALAGLRAADVMSHEVPTVSRESTLEDYSGEVLRTGRRCHLVVGDGRLLGMMNVPALNSVSREEWPVTSVQAVMIPRTKILWAAPEEPLLPLLERLIAADVNQMPVVSSTDGAEGANVVGMVTRDSILRVIQTHMELGQAASN